MPSLLPKFNFGSEIKNINPTLYNQLNDLYSSIAAIVNTKSSKAVYTTDPLSSSQFNNNYDIGDFWVNTTTNKAWIMTSRTTVSNVTWTLIT